MMNRKLEINEAIVVEGRYDKNTLSQIVDALIIETKGFGIFNDDELRRFILRTAEERGIIVLTDSDASGFAIRNEIRSFVPNQFIKEAYIPDVFGKEKRKSAPGKEGKIGVEGMNPEVLVKALSDSRAGVVGHETDEEPDKISFADLYKCGICGVEGSREKRGELVRRLELPSHISTRDLLNVLNRRFSRCGFMSEYLKHE